MQGQRLKEVVQQLQTALRPQQAPEDAETSAASQIGSARAVSDVAYLPLAEGLQKLGIAEQLRSRTPQRSRSAGQVISRPVHMLQCSQVLCCCCCFPITR